MHHYDVLNPPMAYRNPVFSPAAVQYVSYRARPAINMTNPGYGYANPGTPAPPGYSYVNPGPPAPAVYGYGAPHSQYTRFGADRPFHPLPGAFYNPSCPTDDERCARDMQKVWFGAVGDPSLLHPVAFAEWQRQVSDARWNPGPVFDPYTLAEVEATNPCYGLHWHQDQPFAPPPGLFEATHGLTHHGHHHHHDYIDAEHTPSKPKKKRKRNPSKPMWSKTPRKGYVKVYGRGVIPAAATRAPHLKKMFAGIKKTYRPSDAKQVFYANLRTLWFRPDVAAKLPREGKRAKAANPKKKVKRGAVRKKTTKKRRSKKRPAKKATKKRRAKKTTKKKATKKRTKKKAAKKRTKKKATKKRPKKKSKRKKSSRRSTSTTTTTTTRVVRKTTKRNPRKKKASRKK